jgi:hypothetical protein
MKETIDMEKHVQLCGFLWIVHGSLILVGGLAVFGLLFGLSFIPDMDTEGTTILRIVGFSVGGLMWLLSVPKIIAGFGLLKRKEWARILTLILSFLALLNIPLGTALGIYSFIILLKEETVQLFKAAA